MGLEDETFNKIKACSLGVGWSLFILWLFWSAGII